MPGTEKKMVNLGIDFGSTYTLVSYYRGDKQTPEAISLDGVSPYIPSVVSYNKRKNEYKFGKSAKNLTGNKNVIIFKAFKMLLNEQMTEENLRERNYDEVNTPEKIAAYFLERVLKSALAKVGDDHIGKLIVGVPEVWGQSLNTFDGRTAINRICASFDFIDKTEVVSEPACASAFFAYNYKQIRNQNFEGRVLLIDYGGGTLDITLTKVLSNNGSMEVKVEKRDGAGENIDKEIGNAGIKYMEKVVECAIHDCEAFGGEYEIEYDSSFLKAVDELEAALMSDAEDVEDTFRELEFMTDALEDEELIEIDYKDESVIITYKHLKDIYDEIIAGVLREKLETVTAGVDTYEDNFKIGIVGGFGNFYLVKKQIYDMFSISSRDERTEGIIVNSEDRERAISLGASLLANELITIRKTAEFSIGIYAYRADKAIAKYYAIKYRQELEYDKIYCAADAKGHTVPYIVAGGTIDKFLVNFTDSENDAFGVSPKAELSEKLKNVVDNEFMMAAVGFSIDASDSITIHIFDYDWETSERSEKPVRSIRLSTIKSMFDVVDLNGRGDG